MLKHVNVLREQLILILFLFVIVVVKQADANSTNVVYSLAAVQKHSYNVDNQFLSINEKRRRRKYYFIIHHIIYLKRFQKIPFLYNF